MSASSAGRYTGTVIWFDPRLGFGFLSRTGDKDLFVHWSDIESEGFKTLKKGQTVSYGVGLNRHGQPKAIEVLVEENV